MSDQEELKAWAERKTNYLMVCSYKDREDETIKALHEAYQRGRADGVGLARKAVCRYCARGLNVVHLRDSDVHRDPDGEPLYVVCFAYGIRAAAEKESEK